MPKCKAMLRPVPRSARADRTSTSQEGMQGPVGHLGDGGMVIAVSMPYSSVQVETTHSSRSLRRYSDRLTSLQAGQVRSLVRHLLRCQKPSSVLWLIRHTKLISILLERFVGFLLIQFTIPDHVSP